MVSIYDIPLISFNGRFLPVITLLFTEESVEFSDLKLELRFDHLMVAIVSLV